jgi:hypothetical protein
MKLYLTAAVAIWGAAAAGAQTATFDFDNGTPVLARGQSTPFEQTAGGITARFSSPSGASFSIQSDASTGWKMPLFSGNYLYDNNLQNNVLEIRFSQPLKAVSMAFATADFQQREIPTTIQLTALLRAAAHQWDRQPHTAHTEPGRCRRARCRTMRAERLSPWC